MSDFAEAAGPSTSTVFVSYAREDAGWRDRLIAALERCPARGSIVLWADPQIEPGQFWGRELRDAVQRARVALCLVTHRFLVSRFVRQHELPALLARQRDGLRLIPVVVEDCDWVSLRSLSRTQAILGDAPLSNLPQAELDRRLDELWLRLISRLQLGKADEVDWPAPYTIDLHAMSQPSVQMVGREAESHELNIAWTSWETKVVSVVGHAGAGKSLLAWSWLQQMRQRNFAGAHHVFAWSFSGQGGTGAAGATSEAFLNAAVRAWGRPDLTIQSSWRKAQEIVRICRRERCLLVLDGTEVLQDARHALRGTISDIALARLVAELARRQLGLLAMTSREPVPGLPVETAVTLVMDELLEADARRVLRAGFPAISDEDLDALPESWGRNALTLRLVAGAMSMGRALPAPPPEAGVPDRLERALSAVYDTLDVSMRDLLGTLSLFDRALGVDSLRTALPDAPPAAAAHEHARLESLGLVIRSTRDRTIEVHPEVREYVRRRFFAERRADWLASNERLFEEALACAPPRIESATDAIPLHEAMIYGARAGRHQDVLDHVYWDRLLRGRAQDREASWRRFGTIGADLAGLTELFVVPWTKLSPLIAARDRSFVFGQVAMYLGMLGRLDEAIGPARIAVALAEESDPENASVVAGNLSYKLLLRGELDAAMVTAQQAVANARRARVADEVIISLTHLAQVLLAKNELQAALEACVEAETVQRQATGTPLLYGGIALAYNDVLLAHGQWSEVATRARKAMQNPSAAVASDHCMLGVSLLQGFREGGRASLDEARRHLDIGVELARESREIDMLPRPLLARAELHSYRGDGVSAQDDLDEVIDLTSSCGMRLLLVDALILRARRELGSGDGAAANDTCSVAAELATETGYALRREVLGRLTHRARITT
ncbi:MAG: TIR domain-containing protein [Gemmatimonadetes bacterium]|nr:TIR domain-containing protein [Gemmatimonadota bacterium]